MQKSVLILLLTTVASVPVQAETYSADFWADNWFELRVDGETVMTDSVPITTERSFNKESFTFDAERPFVLGVVAKDFKENDTGLEYIGSRRQQMGDGGVIFQIRSQAGETVVVSNTDWHCKVIHTAPLEKSCAGQSDPVAGQGACGFDAQAEPEGWDRAGFNASDWPRASLYSAAEVAPKHGYNEVKWSRDAQFIWGPDLEQSNTVLCRLTVD